MEHKPMNGGACAVLEAADKYIIAWRTAANNPAAASESELSPSPQPDRLAP